LTFRFQENFIHTKTTTTTKTKGLMSGAAYTLQAKTTTQVFNQLFFHCKVSKLDCDDCKKHKIELVMKNVQTKYYQSTALNSTSVQCNSPAEIQEAMI